jgi:hypothetical protein
VAIDEIRLGKLVPAETVKIDHKQDLGIVTGYKQKVKGRIVNVWTPEQIVHVRFTQVASSYFGLSMIAPVYPAVAHLRMIQLNLLKVIKRYSSPKILWPVAGTDEDRRNWGSKIDQFEVDEDFVAAPEVVAAVKELKMDPSGRYDNYMRLIKDEVQTGLMVPSLPNLRNATQASAVKMVEFYQQKIHMVQNIMKRVLEEQVFTPILEPYEGKPGFGEIPKCNFGMPRSGLEDIKVSDIAMLANINVGVLQPVQAIMLLRRLGVPIEDVPKGQSEAQEGIRGRLGRLWRVRSGSREYKVERLAE